MSAQLKVLPRETHDAPSLDERILALVDAWDEREAVSIGQLLTTARGEIEDLRRRNREYENRIDTLNAFQLARWTASVMDRIGAGWYEWMLLQEATTLEKQTLYQYKSELLRIDPELQGQYVVPARGYRAAAMLPTKEAQANFLGAVEQMDIPPQAMWPIAREMRDTNSVDVPAFIPQYNGRMADEPPALTELWASCNDFMREVEARLTRLEGEANAAQFVGPWRRKLQMIVRGR